MRCCCVCCVSGGNGVSVVCEVLYHARLGQWDAGILLHVVAESDVQLCDGALDPPYGLILGDLSGYVCAWCV